MANTASAVCRCRAAATGRVSSRGSASAKSGGQGASVTKVSGRGIVVRVKRVGCFGDIREFFSKTNVQYAVLMVFRKNWTSDWQYSHLVATQCTAAEKSHWAHKGCLDHGPVNAHLIGSAPHVLQTWQCALSSSHVRTAPPACWRTAATTPVCVQPASTAGTAS